MRGILPFDCPCLAANGKAIMPRAEGCGPPPVAAGWTGQSERRRGLARRSSLGTVFRAAVLLVCLVGVPLAAVWGTSLPGAAKRWLDAGYKLVARYFPEQSEPKSPTPPPERRLPEEPRRAPQGSSVVLADYREPIVDPSGNGERSSFRSRAAFEGPPALSHSSRVPLLEAAAALAAPRGDGMASRPAQPEPLSQAATAGARPMAVPPLNWEGRSGMPQSAMQGESAGTALGSSPLDRFSYTEKRLRELGATHYRLEPSGPDGRQYRFWCEMAYTGSSGAIRLFQSTAADPMQAVSEVLSEVETWRSGG